MANMATNIEDGNPEDIARVLLANGRAERRVNDPRLKVTIKLVSACYGNPRQPYIFVRRSDGQISLGTTKHASTPVLGNDRCRMLGLV